MEAWPQPFLGVHHTMARPVVFQTEAAEHAMAMRVLADQQLKLVRSAKAAMLMAEVTAAKAREHWRQTKVQSNWLEVCSSHAKKIEEREAATRTRSRSGNRSTGRPYVD